MDETRNETKADPALARLLKLAWRTVPAAGANEAIARARRATWIAEEASRRGKLEELGERDPGLDASAGEGDGETPMARAYELALPEGATFERFAREQLPRLVYHLESLGAHLPRPSGVVICLFEGERLHFIQVAELIALVCAELRVSADELVRRYGTGELRTAVRDAGRPADPARALALAPPAPGKKS